MNEAQMMIALGWTPKPKSEGLAAPALAGEDLNRKTEAWDRELGGTVPAIKRKQHF